jgi:hypothetical protein
MMAAAAGMFPAHPAAGQHRKGPSSVRSSVSHVSSQHSRPSQHGSNARHGRGEEDDDEDGDTIVIENIFVPDAVALDEDNMFAYVEAQHHQHQYQQGFAGGVYGGSVAGAFQQGVVIDDEDDFPDYSTVCTDFDAHMDWPMEPPGGGPHRRHRDPFADAAAGGGGAMYDAAAEDDEVDMQSLNSDEARWLEDQVQAVNDPDDAFF